nr:thiamin pyrophosphokinase 1 [Hymenolepis microstoma]
MIVNPFSLIDPDVKIGLICLNSDLKNLTPLFTKLFAKASFSIFVDGFANRIYDSQFKDSHFPNMVSGDFDSIRPEVKEFYESKNTVQVINTPDQNETDFTKAILLMVENVQTNLDYIVGLYGSGGRLDHEFGIIKSLYIAKDLSKFPVIIVTEASISCLLEEGENDINMDSFPLHQHCGLIPLGRPIKTTTSGLQWDLKEDFLDFEGLVSTSNRTVNPTVKVYCDGPLLWTISNPLIDIIKDAESS